MKRTALIVTAAFCLAAANPVLMTYLNEFSTDSSHQWLELHPYEGGWLQDLNGAQLLTSTSVCTLDLSGVSGEYAVIDSEGLALGLVGRGSFRLSPVADSIILLARRNSDVVRYPASPAGYGRAPAPPPVGSASFWRTEAGANWYIDSTGSPLDTNRRYSIIAGAVTAVGESTGDWDELNVVAASESGSCSEAIYRPGTYSVRGLGPGNYNIEAWGFTMGGRQFRGFYRNAVSVGYDRTAAGIDFSMYPAGVRLHSLEPHGIIRYRGSLPILAPSVWIVNEGRWAASFTMWYRITPGYEESGAIAGLASGDSIQTFWNLFRPSTPGFWYEIACSTNFNSPTRLVDSFCVLPRYVSPARQRPLDTVIALVPVQPRFVLRNETSEPDSFPFILQITGQGQSYADTDFIVSMPHSALIHDMATWTPEHPGTYRGWMRLDTVPLPDTSVFTVTVLPSAIGEVRTQAALSRTPEPTIVGGALNVPRTASRLSLAGNLFDATGRNVTVLKPGPNDVSRLAPGVYFVKEQRQATSFRPQPTRRVIITK